MLIGKESRLRKVKAIKPSDVGNGIGKPELMKMVIFPVQDEPSQNILTIFRNMVKIAVTIEAPGRH